jgi:hypothetical protein
VKTKQYTLSYLLACDLAIVACAWSESVTTEMIVSATVTKSCRISAMHDLTTAGLIHNSDWFDLTSADNREGSCPSGSLPRVIVEPKSYHPIINKDSENGLLERSGHVTHTEVIFTPTPRGLGAKVAHRLLDTPQDSESRHISENGSSAEGKPSGDEQATFKITIHF